MEVLNQHEALIFRIANSYCKDSEARKDLFQEIVLQLWRAWPRYDATFALTTWMYRIGLNVAISYLRKETSRRKKHDGFAWEEQVQDSAEDPTEEKIARLYAFINDLGPLDKAIMILHLDEKKHAEIAEITGISPTNVSTRFYRIRKKLTEHFKSETN